MSLDKHRLVDFLQEVGSRLDDRVVLVAVGGTAMTLLDIKESTLDVDFTGPKNDIRAFREALERTPHGFKVDVWEDGVVFSQILPEDYLHRSLPAVALDRVDLRALHPVDVIATKAGRLDARDMEDIEACIRVFQISRDAIVARVQQVVYVGREENYTHNVQVVLDRFFDCD